MTGHRHYYADPSGGFGWPSCVICGKPAGVEEFRPLRACCRTPETEVHLGTCNSVDARLARGQTPFPGS